MSAQCTVSAARYGVGQTLGLPGGLSVLVTSAPGRLETSGPLTCGGQSLVPQSPPACSLPAPGAGTIRPGQRFTDPASGLAVVCTRGGHGVLTFAGRPLERGAA